MPTPDETTSKIEIAAVAKIVKILSDLSHLSDAEDGDPSRVMLAVAVLLDLRLSHDPNPED